MVKTVDRIKHSDSCKIYQIEKEKVDMHEGDRDGSKTRKNVEVKLAFKIRAKSTKL